MKKITEHQKQRDADSIKSFALSHCSVCGLRLYSLAQAVSHFNTVHKIKIREKPPIYPRELR